MNEQRIEELKNALREVMQFVVQRDQPLTDELRTMLVQVMEHVANRIQELRQETVGAPQVPDNMTESMPSSNVSAFAYDPKKQQLFVRFLGKYPNRQGPVYSYQGVPEQIFNLFKGGMVPARTDGKNRWGRWWKGKVPSMGASMYTLIKAMGYPYQKLA